jgi:hypothetical protein
MVLSPANRRRVLRATLASLAALVMAGCPTDVGTTDLGELLTLPNGGTSYLN